MEEALSVAADLLKRAEELFAAGDFAAAREWGRTADQYLDQLSSGQGELRRINLRVTIEELENYVDGFDFPPNDAAPLKLRRLIESARDELEGDHLDECWSVLQDAQEEVDKLAKLVAARSKGKYQDRSVEVAEEVLREMGYACGPVRVPETGVKEFEATRGDGAGFRLRFSTDGLLQYEANGFGDLECQREADRFFERLAQKQMQVSVQSELSATIVAERMREVLLRRGYSVVEEEVDPSGVLLTARRKGQLKKRVKVDADGDPQTLSEESESTLDRIDFTRRKATDEKAFRRAAERQYWRQWRQRRQRVAATRLRV
jgi:hypothetical protein